MQNTNYAFNIGAFQCYIFSEGFIYGNSEKFYGGADKDDLDTMLQKHGFSHDKVPSWFNHMLIKTNNHNILVDTGIGDVPTSDEHGHLIKNLKEAGLEPKDITIVINTHAHSDHISGNTDDTGQPRFPNARYLMSRVEWDYWTTPKMLADEDNHHVQGIQKRLLPIKEHFEFIELETEILPGIQTIPAPGHTPGQIALHIASENEHLLYLSDSILTPIHLERPDWNFGSDLDYEQSPHTRRKLLNLAIELDALVTGYHMPFPALYRVKQNGDQYEAIPHA